MSNTKDERAVLVAKVEEKFRTKITQDVAAAHKALLPIFWGAAEVCRTALDDEDSPTATGFPSLDDWGAKAEEAVREVELSIGLGVELGEYLRSTNEIDMEYVDHLFKSAVN